MTEAAVWPLDQARNDHSQSGEDGIVEAILSKIPERNNWVVEFGALDGLHCSNSRYFIKEHQFSAVLIEGDPKIAKKLAKLYEGDSRVHAIHRFVQNSGKDSLDDILSETSVPTDFDYLSIDIDGNDYYVWESLSQYHPKVVVIEFNPSVPSEVNWVQENNPRIRQGAGVRAIVELGQRKGYELVALGRFNAYFVRKEFFGALGIADNSIATLRRDQKHVTYIWTGFDGTTFTTGGGTLPWHLLPLRAGNRQELPRFLRHYFWDYNLFQKLAFVVYFALRAPKRLVWVLSEVMKRRRGETSYEIVP